MKKGLLILIGLFLIFALAACGNDDKGSDKKLVVAATPVPHAEVLEKVKPILKDQGIDLDIKIMNDYNTPNIALDEKSVDANYFQSIPYFELQMKEKGFKFTNAGGIHIEPIGIYSTKYKSLNELPDGAEILLSNSVSDHGRILSLFADKGLITIKDGVKLTDAQIEDIIDNPKNLQFKADYQADLLPRIYQNSEGDAVIINSNFALGAGLNPMEDAIALESEESVYVNIIAVREGDENNENIKALVEALQSKEIQDWIIKEYNGSVVPVK